MSDSAAGGTARQIPESLRQAVSCDLKPVCPLATPWRRMLWVVPLTIVAFLLPQMIMGQRPDLARIGFLLAWFPVIVQLLLGLGLMGMALREAVPGLGVSRGMIGGLMVTAVGLHVVVNSAIWLYYPSTEESVWSLWWLCFRHELFLGIPFLLVVGWLAARALPVRPRTIGLLSGVGAGVMADATWRMVCPISEPSHVLSSHLAPVFVLGAIGYLLGWIWERSRCVTP
jgi:hypothetical protein